MILVILTKVANTPTVITSNKSSQYGVYSVLLSSGAICSAADGIPSEKKYSHD
jgi:hypothetical protein